MSVWGGIGDYDDIKKYIQIRENIYAKGDPVKVIDLQVFEEEIYVLDQETGFYKMTKFDFKK